MSTEPWAMTAVEMAAAIRDGELSSREATTSCLARIEATNPRLNALVEVFDEDALEAADKADQARARGEANGPLHGVPVATKINTDEAGRASSHGLVAWKDAVAAADNPSIRKLREAGAVFLGRANSPAMSYRWFTNNDLFGATVNPRNPELTPGGSSGGSAAAVAAGMVPLAHGNDGAGSLRQPASACGVVGIRPTVGRIPSWLGPADADQGMFIQQSWAQGSLTRTVADARLALNAMSGWDPRDPLALPDGVVSQFETPLEGPIRVALVRDVDVDAPHPAVNEALDFAADRLSQEGYVVEEVAMPVLEEGYRHWFLLALSEFRALMPIAEEFGDDRVRAAAALYYEAAEEWWGPIPSFDTYAAGFARRGTLIGQLQEFMQGTPLLLTPVSSRPPFSLDEDLKSPEHGMGVLRAMWSMIGIPTFGIPAISVPTSVTFDGIPLGVQLVGRKYREDTVFDAAEVIERAAGGFAPLAE